MSLLLETSLGDITIDLDTANSPNLCLNILKLAKARYYTNTLIYNVQHGRFCQTGDPRGDGLGGCSIYGLIDSTCGSDSSVSVVNVEKGQKRFIKSRGNKILTEDELMEKGRVVATEMGGVQNTIGSQFLITIDSGRNKALDGIAQDTIMGAGEGGNDLTFSGNMGNRNYYSLGKVTEDDDDVLSKINNLYCDKSGRPYADVRIIRMHILDDPYHDKDPEGMDQLMQRRNVTLLKEDDLPPNYAICARWLSSSSPTYQKPREEIVQERISYEEAMVEQGDEETERKKREEMLKKEDKSNAAILEMLGDIGSADMKPPENVLFVCKLNSITEDEDLQLIFSRFDQNAKAEIIRDPDTGDSLQYAFIEFDTKEACTEAYFKMNNALIDDRRIKVDFSQSVAKEWNRYTQRKRGGSGTRVNNGQYRGYGNNNRQTAHRPKQEKKYYGGYHQNHNSNAYQEHNNIDARSADRYHTDRDGRVSAHDDSGSLSSSHHHRRRHQRNRSRSPGISEDDHSNDSYDDRDRRRKDHKRKRDKSRSRHHRQGSSGSDDKERSRHHKKRKHKEHKHRSKDIYDDDEKDRRKDKRKSSKRQKSSSSKRNRSCSRDRESSKRRYRSRSR